MKTLILAMFVFSAAGATRAQAAGKTRTAKRAPVARSVPVPEKRPDPKPVEARAESTETAPEPQAETRAAPTRTPKTKVYNFSGLDVEGRLKTPQLLYFLNRVKLELDTTGREKRSFLKELEQSSDDKGL
jgi:hypothetical protein